MHGSCKHRPGDEACNRPAAAAKMVPHQQDREQAGKHGRQPHGELVHLAANGAYPRHQPIETGRLLQLNLAVVQAG